MLDPCCRISLDGWDDKYSLVLDRRALMHDLCSLMLYDYDLNAFLNGSPVMGRGWLERRGLVMQQCCLSHDGIVLCLHDSLILDLNLKTADVEERPTGGCESVRRACPCVDCFFFNLWVGSWRRFSLIWAWKQFDHNVDDPTILYYAPD